MYSCGWCVKQSIHQIDNGNKSLQQRHVADIWVMHAATLAPGAVWAPLTSITQILHK